MSALPSLRIAPTVIRKPRTVRKPKAEIKQDHALSARRWSLAGVGLMATMSAGLNSLAFAQSASIPALGVALGVGMTAIIFILGHVAGACWHGGRRTAAKTVGCIGSGVLLLSVWHGATSIAALTGSPIALALPMALAIDCGFVACEVIAATV